MKLSCDRLGAKHLLHSQTTLILYSHLLSHSILSTLFWKLIRQAPFLSKSTMRYPLSLKSSVASLYKPRGKLGTASESTTVTHRKTAHVMHTSKIYPTPQPIELHKRVGGIWTHGDIDTSVLKHVLVSVQSATVSVQYPQSDTETFVWTNTWSRDHFMRPLKVWTNTWSRDHFMRPLKVWKNCHHVITSCGLWKSG
jgi:hypothetical protein